MPPEGIRKREELRAVADRHRVDLRTVALQLFANSPEAVALVVGARGAPRIQEDWNSMQAKIPGEFWDEFRQAGLIEANAPAPAG